MSLSVVIIARNEEKLIGEAIESAKFADEVLVLDTGSTDKTAAVAKKAGARVIKRPTKGLAFARWRTEAIKEVRGDWIFYLDADERITPELKSEILQIVSHSLSHTGCVHSDTPGVSMAYAVPRENYYLGRRVRWGGAWPDYVKRLFWKKALKKWTGRLHEEPVFEGKLTHLRNPIRHYTHRDLTSMVAKTIEWSKLEAEELYRAHHPPVTWWRILRIMLTELWQRGIRKQGFRDGTVGVIEVIFQVFSRFITYARLWEIQIKNSKS